jgi:hypothetical protein
MRKVTRGILCAASVLIFPALSLSSMAQGPTNQQSTGRAPAAATIDGATAAAIAAEGGSRPRFARSRVIIPARCTVIIGGAITATSAISRAIISWLHPIIASINWCSRNYLAAVAAPFVVPRLSDVLLGRTPSNTHLACCLPPLTTIDLVNFLPRVWRQSLPVCTHAGGGTEPHVPVAMRSESQLAATMVTA